MREARTAAKLDHPNIVRVHGMGEEEHTPYFAMDLVEGETLAEIVARIRRANPDGETRFGARDQLAYFAKIASAFGDVADGLQHAHAKGVVHRDIKPSNLILDRNGRLRILDFGLARVEGYESLSFAGGVLGTPLYMSPSRRAGERSRSTTGPTSTLSVRRFMKSSRTARRFAGRITTRRFRRSSSAIRSSPVS